MPDDKKPAPHPASLVDLVVSAKNPLTRVYNKTGRTFMHGTFRAPPNSFANVPESLADFWIETFKDQIVEAGTAQRELGGANARVVEVQAKLDEANKKISVLEATPKNDRASAQLNALQAELNGAKETIKGLEAQVFDLTDQLEKATAPAAPEAKAGADSV